MMRLPYVLLMAGLCFGPACSDAPRDVPPSDEELFVARDLLPDSSFTPGVEGPAVDADGMLYAVNYERQQTIGRVAPDGTAEVFVTLPDSSVGNGIRFMQDGTMLIADYVGHNVLTVDPATRRIGVLAHEPRMNQPNDLAIDDADRIYASDPNWADSTGQLWRIDPDGTVTLLEAGMGTTNGIEVSPDGQRLYVAESMQRTIWAYDLHDGAISNKRIFATFPDFGLDGMRADVDGNLYVTRYGKGTVAKLAPDGTVLQEVTLKGENPSNIAFGGPDGRTAYVTIADRGTVETFRVDRPGRAWARFINR